MDAGELILPISPRESEDAPFEVLLRTHERFVFRTAYRLLGRFEDAQDAAQEVFLRFFRYRNRLVGDPKPWLYRVTVNVCRDFRRRQRPAEDLEFEQPDASPGPERVLELDERKRLLMEGLQMLPERERAAIVLRDIEGLSTAEAAAILGVEEATVRSQIWSARVKLAKYVRNR